MAKLPVIEQWPTAKSGSWWLFCTMQNYVFLSCLSSPLLRCHLRPKSPTHHWKGMKFGQHYVVPKLQNIPIFHNFSAGIKSNKKIKFW